MGDHDYVNNPEYYDEADNLKLVKKYCPFLSGTFPMGYTTLTVPGCGAINKFDKKNIDAFIADQRNEMIIKKCPDDLHFEYDVHIVTYSNSKMLNMTHMYHSCLRENCMMWDTGTQICRIGTRTKPTPPGKLVNEFINKQDYDGNGLIYGVDFIIQDDSAPEMVKQYTSNMRLDTIDGLQTFTWPQYLNTIKYTDNDCYYFHDPYDDELHHKPCDPNTVQLNILPG